MGDHLRVVLIDESWRPVSARHQATMLVIFRFDSSNRGVGHGIGAFKVAKTDNTGL